MTTAPGPRPPAIVLGGAMNALSIARRLGRRGVTVHTVGVSPPVERSRFVTPLGTPGRATTPAQWADLLLGPASAHLRGAVLLVGSDEGLAVLDRHRDALAARFVLEERDPTGQRRMLDKLQTYEQARRAGVGVPAYRRVMPGDAAAASRGMRFPVIVKPLHSHLYQRVLPGKFVVAHDEAGLDHAMSLLDGAGIEALVMEIVAGPDTSSCYTYIRPDGTAAFIFTKRNVRRFPEGMGQTTLHMSDDVPGVVQPSLRLLREAGVVGLAAVEWKWESRDSEWRLIECNARFTAGDTLLAESGLDLPWFVYTTLTGATPPPMHRYRRGATQWLPASDVLAMLELRRKGTLSSRTWLRQVTRRHALPYLSRDDPAPSASLAVTRVGAAVRHRLGRG